MILISHRGNLKGPNAAQENRPSYIDEALNAGFHVEVDIWWYKRSWYLGHDAPIYKLRNLTLLHERHLLIFHAKNPAALVEMREQRFIHYFWHQDDDYTLTSQGFIWVYPGKLLLKNSICVAPEEEYQGDIKKCYGICTNYPLKYQKLYK